MTDILDRVKKLLALATSPFPEEARTAAFKAAQLIKEHKIELRLPGTVGAAPPWSPPPKTNSEERRIIVSQFEGWCRVCKCAYAAGERVAWAKGKGAIHANCWTEQQARRQA